MNKNKKFYLLILLFELLASGTHIVAKSATYEIHPALLMLLRASLSAFVFTLWLLFNQNKVVKIERADWLKVFLLALLNIPLNQFLFLIAVKLTTAPNVSLAYALTPAFVLILAISFFNEKATFKKTLGVIIAFTGTAVILFERGFNFSSDYFLGFLIVLCAAFFYALFTIIGRDISMKYGPVYAMSLSMIIGTLIYIPIFFLMDIPVDLGIITTVQWFQVIYLGFVTSGIAYGLWYTILTMTESSKAAVFNNLQPVFTTIFSIIIFGLNPSIPFLAGGILIITGVIVTQRG